MKSLRKGTLFNHSAIESDILIWIYFQFLICQWHIQIIALLLIGLMMFAEFNIFGKVFTFALKMMATWEWFHTIMTLTSKFSATTK